MTASVQATAASALPIITSGTILAVAGYGVFFMSSVTAIADLGHLIGRGAIFSMIMVLGLLPNLFVWADRFIILKNGELTPSFVLRLMNSNRKKTLKLLTSDTNQQGGVDHEEDDHQ